MQLVFPSSPVSLLPKSGSGVSARPLSDPFLHNGRLIFSFPPFYKFNFFFGRPMCLFRKHFFPEKLGFSFEFVFVIRGIVFSLR